MVKKTRVLSVENTVSTLGIIKFDCPQVEKLFLHSVLIEIIDKVADGFLEGEIFHNMPKTIQNKF